MIMLCGLLPPAQCPLPWSLDGKDYPTLAQGTKYGVCEHFCENVDPDSKFAVMEIFDDYTHKPGIYDALAAIDYDWSDNASCSEPTLAPESPQTQIAYALLAACKILVQEETYKKRLNSHCMLVKKLLAQSSMPKATLPINKKKVVGRNEPCPCGSNKKYKKCCFMG